MAAVQLPPPTAAQIAYAQSELLLLQKYMQEKFSRYRNGDRTFRKPLRELQQDFANGNTRHYDAIRARNVPRANYTGTFTDAEQRHLQARADFLLGRTNTRYGNPNPQPMVLADAVQRATGRTMFSRATALMPARNHFTFVKILGAGGFGLVTLWKWTPGGDPQAPGQDVVLKVSTAATPAGQPNPASIRDERSHMRVLGRAPHIVQLFRFQDRLPAATRAGLRHRAEQLVMATRLDNANDLLFMEFGRLGDLHKWMHKLGSRDNHLPVDALWHIFDCLVKACIAMDYSPRIVPGPSIPPGANFAPLAGGYIPETIPPGGHDAPLTGFCGIVHFDMDPRNIFVRGYDERSDPLVPTHEQIPRFQVADFGLAKAFADLWDPPNARNAYTLAATRYKMWGRREMAKERWFLPEQFTADWDQLHLDPTVGPPGPAGAAWPAWLQWPMSSGPGRYTHRSNIWHIGMNMWCLLLLQYPDFPPVAGRMTSEEPPGIAAAAVPRDDQRWTYGHELIGPSMMGQALRTKFTPALCETVAKCLMARQEHRPDLQQLQAIITAALGSPPPPLPAEVARFFGNDPAPPAPWRMRFQTVATQDLDPWGAYSDEEGDDAPPARPRRRRPRGRRPTRLAPEDRAYRP